MPIARKTVAETNQFATTSHILIVMIVRNKKAILPRGSEIILPGDEIIVMMPQESLSAFRTMINIPQEKTHKIVVFGDSYVAVELARKLGSFSERVILVDPDEQHAQQAAAECKGIEVLLGDCTNVSMLQEVHVENLSCFIAAGRDAQDNIMACLLAKAEGAREVIAVSAAQKHAELFMSVGLDHIVNPHVVTAQTIIGNIIKVPIGSLLSLKNVNIVVNRFVAGKRALITGKPISEILPLIKRDIIVGTVFTREGIVIPSGNTVVNEGDEVLILSQPQDMGQVGRLFKPRIL
jgi:trk system potassium uptake protein TrkA